MTDDIVDRLRRAERDRLDPDNKLSLFLVLSDARAEITRLREERRWIPVTERAPDSPAVMASDGDAVAEARHYAGYGFEAVGGDELGFAPTHWMPMPKPPGGEVE